MRKKKKDINKFINKTKKLDNLQNKVKKFTKYVPLNNLIINENHYNEFHLDSWLNNQEQNITNNNNILKIDKGEKNSKIKLKCKKINIYFNNDQKKIMLNWFDAYRIMYNKTVQFIKNYRKDHKEFLLNFKTIRTYHLKNIKADLIKKFNTYSHVLDGAIKLACASFKAALSNLKAYNIKHFNIGYIKQNKKSKILDIEKCYFHKKGFFSKIIGDVKNTNNYDYSNINHDCKLHYNYDTDKYTLLVPESIEDNILENRDIQNDYISIDPGERTFLTCLTKNKIIECGTNIKDNIKNILDKIKHKK